MTGRLSAVVPDQVMEELIAKSKAGKAERQMQKEEDLTATDILDASFEGLLQAGQLTALMKVKGARHDRQAAQNAQPQDDGDAEFDRMRRELAFESRAKVMPKSLLGEIRIAEGCGHDIEWHACAWQHSCMISANCQLLLKLMFIMAQESALERITAVHPIDVGMPSGTQDCDQVITFTGQCLSSSLAYYSRPTLQMQSWISVCRSATGQRQLRS